MLLPQWEMDFYLLVSVGFHIYSFYEVYLLSQEYIIEYDNGVDLEEGTLFWGLKKDTLDFEWSFWTGWARVPLLVLLIGHIVVSLASRYFMRALQPWCLMIYGMFACWFLLGIYGFGLLLLHIAVSYTVAQLRIPLLSWVCSLFLIATLQVEAIEEETRAWYRTENEYYLLQFTLAVRCLFYTSFCLEYCWQQKDQESGYSLSWLLLYMFYYPMFHNGPIMNFDEFRKEMQKQKTSTPKTDLLVVILGVFRLFWWWWLAELMIRLMHMHEMYASDAFLRTTSLWILGGLALAHVLFFYVKYLVLYGLPALVVRIDGLRPLPLPRCVSTMYSFTEMWRSFDVGLHRFLIRYIYIPIGGSKSGHGGMLLSTGITFAFVTYWHGAHQNLWCWAVLNWIGINTEYIIRRLLSCAVVRSIVCQKLSPEMQRRFHATLAAVATSMLILTNLVFLGGEHVGKIYWEKFFIEGWPWAPIIVWAFLYCYAHIGIEWDRVYHLP